MKVDLRMVKFPIAGVIAALSLSLGGCVTYGQTHALVTPFGVAGIHTFAPPKKSPDDLTGAQKTAERIAKTME